MEQALINIKIMMVCEVCPDFLSSFLLQFNFFFLQDSDLEIVSLWQVKLFPVFESCRESTSYAINMLSALKDGSKIKKGNSEPVQRYLSMKDVLDFKDIEGTLKIRENLRKKILET